MSTYIIYKTTNLVNGKIYVGQHNTSANDGYLGSGLKIINSILKYGKENFKREILEFCTSSNVNEREIFWIDELSARNRKIGYNITIGGECSPMLGRKHLKKSKIKISQNCKGRKVSNETKNKMSKSQRNRVISKNHRQKISQTMLKNKTTSGENSPSNKYFYILSNNQNFWEFFTTNEKQTIRCYFRRKKKDKVVYKNIIIERRLKND